MVLSDIPFEFTAWRCSSTAASVVVGTVGNVFFGNLGTCALVNFLPTDLAGELLAELDAYRCTQTAPALVGSQHLGRCNGLVALLVLSVLHGSVQVGINRNELLAYRDAEALQDIGLHRLHVLSHSSS